MKILAIFNGEYGKRHVRNITQNGPADWQVETWQAPAVLPPVVDYPEDYLPKTLPSADLILSFAEVKGVAELLPDIAKMTGAKAVLAPIDNDAWLPRGLARQLCGWLERMGVACATPKPLCSLTEEGYLLSRREKETYDDPFIRAFAQHFGKPELKIALDADSGIITDVQVLRDAVCGCARYAAEKLPGATADEAEEKSGLLHHHYPCMASMVKDPTFNHDTLMHVSGNLLKDNVRVQVKPYKNERMITPGSRVA